MALLRAINVGGHVVKMARLRELFAELGLEEVSTVIASGNVLFSSRASARTLEPRIERHLRESLGYEVATFLRSPRELAAATAHQPFPSIPPVPSGQSLSVVFLKEPLGKAACAALCAQETPTDHFSIDGREVWWWCEGRISDSRVTGARLEKAVGGPITARNITTIRKLAEAAVTR